MLVHTKYFYAHAPTLMIVVSLCGVDIDIKQLWESIIFSSTLQYDVPWIDYRVLHGALLHVLL